MPRKSLLQALAGAGLAMTGFAGLSTLPATPAVAQETHGGDTVDMQQMQQMMNQCVEMMDDMPQTMEDMPGMNGGMSNMMNGR